MMQRCKLSFTLQVVAFTQHITLTMCVVLAVLISACSSVEPSDKQVKQFFLQRSGEFVELLKIFQKDKAKADISFVSAENPSRTQCGLRPHRHSCSLSMERWEEYSSRLQELGILWVEYEKPAERYYFVTYYEPTIMNARLRGMVFSPTENSQVSSYHPKQEWWSIQGGWHSFLMIDD